MCYICQSLTQESGNLQSPLFSGNSATYTAVRTTGGLFGQVLETETMEAFNGAGSLPSTGRQDVDGLLFGAKYGSATIGTGATIRIDFTRPIDGSSPLNATAKQVMIDWQQKVANVANLTFVNVTSGDYEISYGMKNLSTGGGVKGYAAVSYSGKRMYSGPIVLDDDSSSLANTHFMYTAALHELLHGLGFAHSFSGSVSQSTVGPNKNNTDFTVMAYTGGKYSSGGSTTNRITDSPMWGDIMGLRHLYGKNTNYHSGNDTFTPTHTRPETIIDGNGNDTVLLNGFTTGDAKVDLRFDWGAASDDRVNLVPINGGLAKFWFADQFENVVSGAGNDVITGNDTQNYLYGGEGNDQIFGLSGNDAIFGGKEMNDANERGNDQLDGGAGDDIIFGNGGNDTLAGGDGNDTLFGGMGNDLYYGNTGNDYLVRGNGQDSLYGGLGADKYCIGYNDGGATIVYQMEPHDVLMVLKNANNSGIHSAQQVIDRMIDVQGNVWINGLNTLIANADKADFSATSGQIVVVDSFW